MEIQKIISTWWTPQIISDWDFSTINHRWIFSHSFALNFWWISAEFLYDSCSYHPTLPKTDKNHGQKHRLFLSLKPHDAFSICFMVLSPTPPRTINPIKLLWRSISVWKSAETSDIPIEIPSIPSFRPKWSLGILRPKQSCPRSFPRIKIKTSKTITWVLKISLLGSCKMQRIWTPVEPRSCTLTTEEFTTWPMFTPFLIG